MTRIDNLLRNVQANDESAGLLYDALNKFADRTLTRFYDDAPDIPRPILSFDKDRADSRGFYQSVDGLCLEHRINLNIFVLRDGLEAAETLAHELVHLFMDHIGQAYDRHDEMFHARMEEYGILTIGDHGRHVSYTSDGRWQQWLDENADLSLEKFTLPGMDRKPTRRMHKHECQGCGNSFQSRKEEAFTSCLDCDVPFIVTT